MAINKLSQAPIDRLEDRFYPKHWSAERSLHFLNQLIINEHLVTTKTRTKKTAPEARL